MLGFQSLIEGEDEFTISLASFMGDQLSEATIFLFDNVTGITTNLNESNYQFRSGKTKQDRRFTVLFETEEGTILGLEGFTKETIVIYPNPANNQLNIRIPNALETQSIKIIDMLGKTLLTKNRSIENHTILDITNLNTGVYFIEISINETRVVRKIIKQ